jgi:protein-S-isoprenylcysteine O-methyltransferase Ste14
MTLVGDIMPFATTIGIPNAIFMVVSSGIFLTFAWGVIAHFRSSRTPTGMRLISIVSLLSIVVVEFQAWQRPLPPLWVGLGLTFHLVSLSLFLMAVRETRKKRLTLAFDDDHPTFLVATGPYRYIRHPFYASYILFWIGCSAALRDPYVATLAIIIFLLYFLAAHREEEKFNSSTLRNLYQGYKQDAGFLWPKLRSRS